jgi:hypothetical protein
MLLLFEFVRCEVAQARVGPHSVVVASPRLDEDGSFGPSTKPLETEALVSKLAVEALVHPILPRLSRSNVRGVDVGRGEPAVHSSRKELRAIVGTQVLRSAMETDEPREDVDDASGADAAGDVDGEAFPRPLVHDGEALQLLAIGAGVEDEVVGPDVVSPTRRQWPRPA